MKNYSHVVSYLRTRPWAMHPDAALAMCEIVAARVAGEKFDADKADFVPDHGGTPYYVDIAAGISPQTASATARKDGRVAVLPIRGTILNRLSGMAAFSGGTGMEQLAKAFIQLRDDNGIKAIVLDIDSLGGSVEGLPETAKLIRDSREAKPIVAQVNVRAASAAYWLATAAQDIAVAPSGDVGSIGVITLHQDFSAALTEAGITTTIIASSPFKGEGNPYEPLSDDAKAAIEADVMAFDEMFHDAVAGARGAKVATVRSEFGQGRMVLAEEAVKRGMADRVATMEQTLNRFGASLYGAAPGRRAEVDEEYASRRRARRANRRFLQVANRTR